MDALEQFKAGQRQAWGSFSPFELVTSTTAPRLVGFAGVRAGQQVLDVGCGTGVVAITARRRGARVTGIDLTPELLQRARKNAVILTSTLSGMKETWRACHSVMALSIWS
jgi:2-polyprenyl-3-methyl-5-hydroxy-6-metoxy-1,4-benzoquinol methylase